MRLFSYKMDGSHSINVPQLPSINLLLMDSTDSKSNDEGDAPSQSLSPSTSHGDAPSPSLSPSTSPDLQQFFLNSKIHDAILSSEAELAKCLSDFHVATTTAVAATRIGTALAVDAYMREAEACHTQMLEAHAEFRNAVVVSLTSIEEHAGATAADFHDSVVAAAFGLRVRLAAVMTALERQQTTLHGAHGRAAAQFCKAAEVASMQLHASSAEAADNFTKRIYSLLHDGNIPMAFDGTFQQIQNISTNVASEPINDKSYELEKYKTVMQMMNMACDIRKKIQHLTSQN